MKPTALALLLACLGAVAYGQRISTIQLEGVQYFISKMNPYSPALNYFLAYQYCRSLGLQLTSFESKEKADGIVQYLKNGGLNKYDFWTSGNRLGTDMFLWMSTGLPFNATFDYMVTQDDNVEGEEESNVTEEGRSDDGASNGCVVLKAPHHKWATDDCTMVKDFICEQTRCYYYNYGSIPVSTAQGASKEKNASLKSSSTEAPTTTTTSAPTTVTMTELSSTTMSSTTMFTSAASEEPEVPTSLPPLLNFTVQRRSSLRPHFTPVHAREKTPMNEMPLRQDVVVNNNRHGPRNFDGKGANTNVVYVRAVGAKDGQAGWSLAYIDKNTSTESSKDPEPTKQTIMLTRNTADKVA